MKKVLSLILIISILLGCGTIFSYASDFEENENNDINNEAENSMTSVPGIESMASSAILLEASTGTVLYAKDQHKKLSPASVTKIMTLLLVAEELASGSITLEQSVTVSSNAASMGGSQIFLKEGECFTVDELLKSTVIASANDAAVALAELISGSEAAFVARMNERAGELGMKNTDFENCTGLDDTTTSHLTSAYDIALMSRELIKHDIILKHSGVWQDSIRNGEFVLTNTNRLVRYYSGCTGLKTGSTDKAGYCVSATAKRDGMHLIAVVMGAESRDKRNECARALLDYGFSNYAIYQDPAKELEIVPVKRGVKTETIISSTAFSALISKSDIKKIEKKFKIPESLAAPLAKDQVVGEVVYYLGDKEIGKADICAIEQIDTITLTGLLRELIVAIIAGK